MVWRRKEVKRPGLRSEEIEGSHWGGGERKRASGVFGGETLNRRGEEEDECCVGEDGGKLVGRRKHRQENNSRNKKRGEKSRGEEAAGLGWGPGEKKLGPRIRNQAPRGWSRCRLRARPLGLKGLPELKTICTAPFLIWLSQQPTLHTDCLSSPSPSPSPCLTDQRSTKRGKHTQSKIKIGTPLARQNKLEQTNYRESTHKQWSICGSLDYWSRWLPPTPPPPPHPPPIVHLHYKLCVNRTHSNILSWAQCFGLTLYVNVLNV